MDAAEHYQKGSLRNRCHIAGPNGPQRLSIPLLKGKHQQTPIQAVRISYEEPWQRQHWRSIQAAYGNAPFFEHYADAVQAFYTREWPFLFEYNLEWMNFILKQKLGWTGEFILQQDFVPKGSWEDGLDLRGDSDGALLAYPNWFIPQRYPQVFEARNGFLPNLSILDLLFCCGKNGREVLAQPLVLPN